MLKIIIIVFGFIDILRGLLGVFLRITYINPLRLIPKIQTIDFEEAFGTTTARGIFIFFGIMLLLFGFFVL